MIAKTIDGKAIAADICAEAELQLGRLRQQNIQPCLAVIAVGQNPAARANFANKVRVCREIGIISKKIELPVAETEQDLLAQIDLLNNDVLVHGILVQTPLPHHVNLERVVEQIKPSEDVDGFHPYNVGRLHLGLHSMQPCALGVF